MEDLSASQSAIDGVDPANKRARLVATFTHQGRLLFQEREYQKAANALSKVLEFEASNVAALCLRSFCFTKLSLHQLAITDAQIACQQYASVNDFDDEGRAEAMYALAAALYGMGACEEALKAFEHCCHLAPDNVKYNAGRTECLEVMHDMAVEQGKLSVAGTPRRRGQSTPRRKQPLNSTKKRQTRGSPQARPRSSPHTMRHQRVSVTRAHRPARSVVPPLAVVDEGPSMSVPPRSMTQSGRTPQIKPTPHLGLHSFRASIRASLLPPLHSPPPH